MTATKQPRGRRSSAPRGPTAALHRAPIRQRPRPPSKVAPHAHTHTHTLPRCRWCKITQMWWLCCTFTRGVSSFSVAAKAPSQANGHVPKPQPGLVPQVQSWRDQRNYFHRQFGCLFVFFRIKCEKIVEKWPRLQNVNVVQENFKYIQPKFIFKKWSKWHYTCNFSRKNVDYFSSISFPNVNINWFSSSYVTGDEKRPEIDVWNNQLIEQK